MTEAQGIPGRFQGDVTLSAYFDLTADCASLSCKPDAIASSGFVDWYIKKRRGQKGRFILTNSSNSIRNQCKKSKKVLTCTKKKFLQQSGTEKYYTVLTIVVNFSTADLPVSLLSSVVNQDDLAIAAALYSGNVVRVTQ